MWRVIGRVTTALFSQFEKARASFPCHAIIIAIYQTIYRCYIPSWRFLDTFEKKVGLIYDILLLVHHILSVVGLL
jgi:hypothetical protein